MIKSINRLWPWLVYEYCFCVEKYQHNSWNCVCVNPSTISNHEYTDELTYINQVTLPNAIYSLYLSLLRIKIYLIYFEKDWNVCVNPNAQSRF